MRHPVVGQGSIDRIPDNRDDRGVVVQVVGSLSDTGKKDVLRRTVAVEIVGITCCVVTGEEIGVIVREEVYLLLAASDTGVGLYTRPDCR